MMDVNAFVLRLDARIVLYVKVNFAKGWLKGTTIRQLRMLYATSYLYCMTGLVLATQLEI